MLNHFIHRFICGQINYLLGCFGDFFTVFWFFVLFFII